MGACFKKSRTNSALPERFFAKALVHSEKERVSLKLEHQREMRQKMSLMQNMGKLWANWPCNMPEDDARQWSALLSCYERADWGRVLTDSLCDIWSYENAVHGAGPENGCHKWDKIIEFVIEQVDLLTARPIKNGTLSGHVLGHGSGNLNADKLLQEQPPD